MSNDSMDEKSTAAADVSIPPESLAAMSELARKLQAAMGEIAVLNRQVEDLLMKRALASERKSSRKKKSRRGGRH